MFFLGGGGGEGKIDWQRFGIKVGHTSSSPKTASESTLKTDGHPFQKIGVFPPKWMVKIMDGTLLKWDDLGGKPTIFGNSQMVGRPVLFFEWFPGQALY